jgi:uncharacterized membrane protein YkoI
MLNKTRIAIMAAVLVATGATAFAAKSAMENDAMDISKAQITLTQAIAAAEQHHPGGKAARAEFEHSRKTGWGYDVEIISGAKTFDVKVDSQKGTVISSVEDTADRDDDNDKRD